MPRSLLTGAFFIVVFSWSVSAVRMFVQRQHRLISCFNCLYRKSTTSTPGYLPLSKTKYESGTLTLGVNLVMV